MSKKGGTYLTEEERYRKLAMAVCRQWIMDGRPKTGEKTVLYWAQCLRDHTNMHQINWYRQARVLYDFNRG